MYGGYCLARRVACRLTCDDLTYGFGFYVGVATYVTPGLYRKVGVGGSTQSAEG